MTELEMDYLKRAVEVLDQGYLSSMEQAKVLQVVSEITGRAAKKIRQDLVAAVEDRLYNKDTV